MNNRKLKVVQIIIHLGNGGTEALLREYVTNMNRDEFENVIICIMRQQNSASEKLLAEAGIKVHYIGNLLSKDIDIVSRTVNFFKSYYNVHKVLKEEKPDIIHTHLSTNRFMFPYSLFHKDTKYFHTVHCPADVMFNGGLKEKIENFCIKFYTSKRKMRLIALHNSMAEQLNKRFNVNNSIVLENGVYLDKFRNPGVTKEEIRTELGIDKNAFVLGHVGRMCPEKNHELIISVFSEILKKRPDAVLLLVGNGRCENEVMQMIENASIKKNTVVLSNRTDVNRILRAMDVFIFPSHYEGLGIALIEAEASGLKCVISDTIPEETHLSEKLSVRKLTDPYEMWVNDILNETPGFIKKGDIENYNITTVISKLEKIYKGEV